MTANEPSIGRILKCKRKYTDKWYKSEIIDVINDKISVKIWTSILKPKIIEISKTEWKQQVTLSENDPKWIFRVDDNKIFPYWIKIGQIIMIQSKTFQYPNDSRISPKIAKIIHYKDDDFITFHYIRDNDGKNPYNTKPKLFVTDTIYVKKSYQMNISRKFIRFSNNILFPYYNAFENDCYFDKIIELNDKKLIKYLSKNNNDNNKNNNNHHHKSSFAPIIHQECDYISRSKLQYGFIMDCDIFPYDINKLLISFLAQKMIYICPPTPCCKLQTIAQSWQYPGDSLSEIGCEFVMNQNLTINGFELNHIEMLGLHDHQIILQNNIAKQVELNQYRHDAQYRFDNNKCVELVEGGTYCIIINVNANVPCYQWHYTPLDMNDEIKNKTLEKRGRDKTIKVKNWKCFKSIFWCKYRWISYRKEYIIDGGPLHSFPHFALLLP